MTCVQRSLLPKPFMWLASLMLLVCAPGLSMATEVTPGVDVAPLSATDQERLRNQIAGLAAERPGVRDVYFLAIGGDGSESVFMRDIEVARAGLAAQVDLDNRAIRLLNHRDYETLPLATPTAMRLALRALDSHMNPEEDLLFIHLVSHGRHDGALVMQQPGMDLPNLTPEDFARMLAPLNGRRRVLVVSACYSGQWLSPLANADTLILTSARKDRTSFGCGDDSEMTWFTKALYQQGALSLSDPDGMFKQVNQLIRTWEKDIGMEKSSWSHPQFYLGSALRLWLTEGVFE